MRPRIGITTNYVKNDEVGAVAHIGGVGQHWQALADDYIKAVVLAGGLPVMLPILSDAEASLEMLDGLDGLLISGGCDISPLYFGENTTGAIGEVCPERDTQELELMKAALKIPHFPILGICRGCQVLNVALGGSLVMDIDTQSCGEHFLRGQRMSVLTHRIEAEENTLIHGLLSGENRVNSYHHQCVNRPGEGVEITARDAHGIPECIEVPAREGFTLGVQWHPEGLAAVNDSHRNIFKTLVRKADEYREER